jgi:hypothetical protein
MGNDVEEIDADEDNEVLERVAAIDVSKASGKVCEPPMDRRVADCSFSRSRKSSRAT